jgi:hypothetical protein
MEEGSPRGEGSLHAWHATSPIVFPSSQHWVLDLQHSRRVVIGRPGAEQ